MGLIFVECLLEARLSAKFTVISGGGWNSHQVPWVQILKSCMCYTNAMLPSPHPAIWKASFGSPRWKWERWGKIIFWIPHRILFTCWPMSWEISWEGHNFGPEFKSCNFSKCKGVLSSLPIFGGLWSKESADCLYTLRQIQALNIEYSYQMKLKGWLEKKKK